MFRFNVNFTLNGVTREERVSAASAGYARMNIELKYPGAVVVGILGVNPPRAAREERKSRQDVAVDDKKKEKRLWTVMASRKAGGRNCGLWHSALYFTEWDAGLSPDAPGLRR